jgi:hypothetical protein
LPLEEANPTQVYEFYPLRGWIEHYFKPAKYELWWADFQVRPERAIVRHWELVLLATTFSLLVGAVPTIPIVAGSATSPLPFAPPETAAGEKSVVSPPIPDGVGSGERVVWTATLRRVRRWLCPWARLQRYWTRCSSSAPRPELAALLAHVARSLPLDASPASTWPTSD